MATKSYSKHKEYKEFKSNSNNVPYTDEQFDMLKSELLPSNSKLHSLDRNGGGRQYHYEYKEEKHPSGKYDRKDMRTVEEYTIPAKTVPKATENNAYYYTREERELPAINSSTASRTYNYESNVNSTPGYSKVKSSKVTKDLSHNVEELDSLLDDLQKDQERQLYKSGYTSDTAESTSFDYRRGTPAKAPSSGYSTLKKEERIESSSWGSSPPPPVTRSAELRQEMYREEKTESRVVPSQVSPALPQPVPAPVCVQCHHSTNNTLSRSSTPMNKVTTTVKTYTYEVPADQLPLTHQHTSYLSDQKTVNTSTSVVPAVIPPSPSLGCQYCAHCSSRITHTQHNSVPTTAHYQSITSSEDHTNERILYPKPANETKLLPHSEPLGHSPHVPTTYKYSETTYSSENTTERYPGVPPRAVTPRPADTPKKLDDLLADFPEARFPTTEADGVRRRVEVSEVSKTTTKPVSTNVSGPAVYYPPGHTPFQKKEAPVVSGAYQASAIQGGGAYASGRGMYEYESGAKSKEKHSEKKTAVPLCLPLCCAMPCVIM